MIFKNKLNFMIKKRSYEIKKIRLRDINSEYIKSLNISNYLRFKKKTHSEHSNQVFKENQ